MYRILVIDDFFVDRENIIEQISSFKELDIEAIDGCENGSQALDFISRNEPDIIVCDIEMPGMSGFDLARIIRKDYPKIKIIFCTLYNNFDYAKKALYLDGYGYILKPVDAEELKECIIKVTSLINTQAIQDLESENLKTILRESKPVLTDNFIKGLLYGFNKDIKDIMGKIGYLGLNIKEGICALALIEIDDYDKITSGQSFEQKQILSLKAYERIREMINGMDDVIFIRLDDSHFVIMLSISVSVTDSGEECINKLTETCNLILDSFQISDISLSMAISDYSNSIVVIDHLFEQCNYVLRYKYQLGKGKIIHKKDIPSSLSNPEVNYNAIQKEIRFLLNSGDYEGIGCYIDKLFDSVPDNAGEHYLKNLSFGVVICIQTVLGENNEDFIKIFDDDKLIWEKLLKFETIIDVRNWLKNICVYINEYLKRKAANKNKILTGDVKKFIEKKYGSGLCLGILADELFYSPNYLNYIFKQETGETIYEYICKYRMEKAKELLSDPGIRLYEIAEAVGYSQTSYFSNVFKRYTGLTPKEFRERCI